MMPIPEDWIVWAIVTFGVGSVAYCGKFVFAVLTVVVISEPLWQMLCLARRRGWIE